MSFKKTVPSSEVRVLVVDTDAMEGQLMVSALKRCREHFDVLGPAESLEDAMLTMSSYEPHVAILSADLQEQGNAAFLALHKLRQTHPRAAVVVLLRNLERDLVVQVFRAGARGIISKSDSFESLAKCIRCVHDGQVWIRTTELNYLLEALAQYRPLGTSRANDLGVLTKRERQVTQLVANGMSNRDIAGMLHLTEHTVSNYLYRIFDKLGVSTRVQLILSTLSLDRGLPATSELEDAALMRKRA